MKRLVGQFAVRKLLADFLSALRFVDASDEVVLVVGVRRHGAPFYDNGGSILVNGLGAVEVVFAAFPVVESAAVAQEVVIRVAEGRGDGRLVKTGSSRVRNGVGNGGVRRLARQRMAVVLVEISSMRPAGLVTLVKKRRVPQVS